MAMMIPALCASVQRAPAGYRAAGKIAVARWPYFAGSSLPVRVDGFAPPYHVALLGQGSLSNDGVYAIDGAAPATAMLIAGNRTGLAAHNVRIAVPPPPNEPLLAVAAYDDGVVLHDARTFSVLGVLATGGAPSDAAIDASGRLAVPDTQGSAVTITSLSPWHVSHIDGIPLGDDVAIDDANHAVFVTNRDLNGFGALTRVAEGHVDTIVTGKTAEGLAIDAYRQIVYVANVNDGSVAAVSARSMRIVRHFHAVERVFSLALSPNGQLLYAVSNQSASSPFAAPGAVVAFDLRKSPPRIVARSGALTFPVGEALDPATQTLFVTDEDRDAVDVLDAHTLAPKHAPLPTCRTPWKPTLDPAERRLFVPCAREDEIDVFDVRSLRRAKGAPFATGGYPLAIAVWPGRHASNQRPGQ